MAIHMLTGREVLRTHVFWRLMLKRVLWGVFEEMRRYTSDSHDPLEQEGQVAPSWPILGPMLGHLGVMLGQLGPMLAPMLGHLD